jgi:hypothetical protein
MGYPTDSKAKLSTTSDMEDLSSSGSVNNLKGKGGTSGYSTKSSDKVGKFKKSKSSGESVTAASVVSVKAVVESSSIGTSNTSATNKPVDSASLITSKSCSSKWKKKGKDNAIGKTSVVGTVDDMFVILKGTEEGASKTDIGMKDQSSAASAAEHDHFEDNERFSFEDLVKILAKSGGKMAKEDAKHFFLIYNTLQDQIGVCTFRC